MDIYISIQQGNSRLIIDGSFTLFVLFMQAYAQGLANNPPAPVTVDIQPKGGEVNVTG